MDDDDSGDVIRIPMKSLHTSIEQVKLLKAGKAKPSTLAGMFAGLGNHA